MKAGLPGIEIDTTIPAGNFRRRLDHTCHGAVAELSAGRWIILIFLTNGVRDRLHRRIPLSLLAAGLVLFKSGVGQRQ